MSKPLLSLDASSISSLRDKARPIFCASIASLILISCGFRAVYQNGQASQAIVSQMRVNGSDLCADALSTTLVKRDDSPISIALRVTEKLNEENIGADREAARLTLSVQTDYEIQHRDRDQVERGSTLRTRTFTKPASELDETLETENAARTVCSAIALDIQNAVERVAPSK